MCLWPLNHYWSCPELPNGRISNHPPQWDRQCVTYMWSHPFNSYLESFYHTPLPTEKMLLAWMLGHVASGVCNNKVHFWMHRFLTPFAPTQMSSCHRPSWRRVAKCLWTAYSWHWAHWLFHPTRFQHLWRDGKSRHSGVKVPCFTNLHQAGAAIQRSNGWLRCHLSFSLFCSAIIMCVRGACSKHGYMPPLDTPLVICEGRVPHVD